MDEDATDEDATNEDATNEIATNEDATVWSGLVWRDPWMIYKALEVIQIFLAGGRTDGQTKAF